MEYIYIFPLTTKQKNYILLGTFRSLKKQNNIWNSFLSAFCLRNSNLNWHLVLLSFLTNFLDAKRLKQIYLLNSLMRLYKSAYKCGSCLCTFECFCCYFFRAELNQLLRLVKPMGELMAAALLSPVLVGLRRIIDVILWWQIYFPHTTCSASRDSKDKVRKLVGICLSGRWHVMRFFFSIFFLLN